MVLFCQPSPANLAAVKGILEIFRRASGLRINYAKSSATLLHSDPKEAAPVVETLGCPIVEMSFSYLGIPLTL